MNPPNTILRYFDGYQMDDAGHVIANNDDNVVYNEQLYYCSNLCNKIFVAIVYCYKLYHNNGQ